MRIRFSVGVAAIMVAIGAGAVALGTAQAEEVSLSDLVARYKDKPAFIPPGAPIDIKAALAGKTIYAIPATSANPFSQGIFASIQKIAPQIGFTFKVWENQGTLAEQQRGIELAVADKAAIIDMSTGTDPRLFAPQLEQARAAGAKIVDSHASGVSQGTSPNVNATLAAPYEEAGRLQAAYTALDSEKKANVVIITSDEIIGSPVQTKAIQDGLAEFCPDCKVTTVNAPVSQWATTVGPAVRGALLADPGINYILPLYDPEVSFITPVLTELGKTDSVRIVTYAGTPFVLDLIASNGGVAMDVGESADQIGMALVDLYARVLLGEENLSVDRKISLRIWDKSNVSEAGTPAVYSTGYGDAAVEGYAKLWGLK